MVQHRDLDFVRGTYSLLLDTEGAVRDEGNFLGILRNQRDGSWLFAIWLMSTDLPLPEESNEGDTKCGGSVAPAQLSS
jgi:hypothetical protein